MAFLPGEPFGLLDEQLWVRLAFVDFDAAAIKDVNAQRKERPLASDMELAA